MLDVENKNLNLHKVALYYEESKANRVHTKGDNARTNNHLKKVHHDLFAELNNNVERISSKYNYHPTQKVVIELYPDLPTFHQTVGEADAPNWFMGTYEGNIFKIVSPLNPGPEHTYEAKQMTQDYIKESTEEAIRNKAIPTFEQLDNDTWDFDKMKGFQFSYMFVEFVIEQYGIETLNKVIRNSQDFNRIFHCSEMDLHQKMVEHIQK